MRPRTQIAEHVITGAVWTNAVVAGVPTSSYYRTLKLVGSPAVLTVTLTVILKVLIELHQEFQHVRLRVQLHP